MKRLALLFTLLLLLNIVKAQQWFVHYESEVYEDVRFKCGDNSAQYNYVVGNCFNKYVGTYCPIAVCFDENGEYKERTFEKELKRSSFVNALGLGDGNLFVVAQYSSDTTIDYKQLWVAVLNPDLEILSENVIDVDDSYIRFVSRSYSLINSNNEIVVVTKVSKYPSSDNPVQQDYAFYKFDLNCNLLNYNYVENNSLRNDITDFVEVAGTDEYALFGNGMDVSGMSNINYFDSDFNHLSTSFIDKAESYPNLILPIRMSLEQWNDENYFIMSAQSARTDSYSDWCPVIVKMDTDMNVLSILDMERPDTTDYVSEYRSISYVNSEQIYVSTFWYRGFNNIFPNTATIYMINDRLDILGRKTVVFDSNYYGYYVYSTTDGGCIIIGGYCDYYDSIVPYVCKFSSDEFKIPTSLIESNSDLDVGCFPNPVSSSLNIDVKKIMGKYARIVIVDMMGRRYLDKGIFLEGGVLSLDVSNMDNGTYIYKVFINEEQILSDKFVKE